MLYKKIASVYMSRTAGSWGYGPLDNDYVLDFFTENKSISALSSGLKRFFSSKEPEENWWAILVWSALTTCSFASLNKLADRFTSKVKKAASNLLENDTFLAEWFKPNHIIDRLNNYEKGIPDKSLSQEKADRTLSDVFKVSLLGGKRKGLTFFELSTAIDEGVKTKWQILMYNPKNSNYVKLSGVLPGHELPATNLWKIKSKKKEKKIKDHLEIYTAQVLSSVKVETGVYGLKKEDSYTKSFDLGTFETLLLNLEKQGYIAS